MLERANRRLPREERCVGLSWLDAGGSLTILGAETGSDKIETALLRFAPLFQAGLVDPDDRDPDPWPRSGWTQPLWR